MNRSLLVAGVAGAALTIGFAAGQTNAPQTAWSHLLRRVEAAQSQGRGGALGPGQIRPRPAEGREPEFPPPNIREYKPRSTLVVPEHLVPRAKFPVIDIHSHHPTPISSEQYEKVVKAMDQLNIRLLVNLIGSWGDNLR